MDYEEWRDVKDYENIYKVSNLGRIKSLPRKFVCEKIVKPYTNRQGYSCIRLFKNNKVKNLALQTIVAQAFPEICGEWFEGAVCNHINECKWDNRAENIEIISREANSRFGSCAERTKLGFRTPVLSFKNGVFQKEYESAVAAENELNISHSHIYRVAKHEKRYKTAGGLEWEFGVATFTFCHKKVNYEIEDIPLEVGAACRDEHCATLRDDNYFNISRKNPIYAEVTGVFYLWKNRHQIDMLLTQQYRRVLDVKPEDKRPIIESGKIIACKPLVLARGTLKNHFINCHSEKYWELFKEAVHMTAPQYDEAFVKWLETSSSPENPAKIYYSCGMGMYKSDFDRYCEFLFPVLDYIYKALGGSVEAITETVRQDILEGRCRQVSSHGTGLDECVRYQRQVCGFVQERAFTMWARENFEGRIVECPYIKMENTII